MIEILVRIVRPTTEVVATESEEENEMNLIIIQVARWRRS